MHKSQIAFVFVVIGVLLLVFILPADTSNTVVGNCDRTYDFYVHYGDFRFNHRLYISLPSSLYDYYHGETHDCDYPEFVTPSVVEPIAKSIQIATGDKPHVEEEFANAVLMMVHRIPYLKCNIKYPVETLRDNFADCDASAVLAASIMKAGGLDVVLLYYEELTPKHMNLGVHLPYEPSYNTLPGAPTGFEYNNKTYWIAETTPKEDWMIGDQPDSLSGTNPVVITLDASEESAPEQVASNLDCPLTPSSISLNISLGNSSVRKRILRLRISGSVSPACSEKTVLVYIIQDGYSQLPFETVSTDDRGDYTFMWNPPSSGTYYIRTSWGGDMNYTGSDSDELTVCIGSAQGYLYFGSRYIKEFLKINASGPGVLFSSEFIVLRSEQATTAPSSEQTSVNNFGIVLRRNGGKNYTVSATEMDNSDTSQITKQLIVDNSLLNAPMITRENTWYRVAANMSENGTAAELYDENSCLLKSVSQR